MKSIFVLLCIILLASCASWKHQTIENEFGRLRLKDMQFKGQIDFVEKSAVKKDVVYYYTRENTQINMRFHKIIRFYEGNRYAFFSYSDSSNNKSLTLESLPYENFKKASFVGYYALADSVITLETPNTTFRRAGKRNLDRYRVLSNGSLLSITRAASDYNHVYEIVPNTQKMIVKLNEDFDW